MQSPLVQAQDTPTFAADPAAFTDAPHKSSLAASFHQDRGIGQDDTPSAIFWVVLYDVLLCMLDVPTPAGTLELSQHDADIVSTFCAATTLTIAANKKYLPLHSIPLSHNASFCMTGSGQSMKYLSVTQGGR